MITESLVILKTDHKSQRASMSTLGHDGYCDIVYQDEIDCRLKLLAEGYRLKGVVKDYEICEYWTKEAEA